MRFPLLVLICGCYVVSGCSNVKPYTGAMAENLTINVNTDPEVQTSIDIYSVDKACKADYQGTLSVERRTQQTGLPVNQPSYLVVSFATSSFWSGGSSRMSQETLLTPKKGYRYQYDLSYIDGIYNIELRQIHRKTGKAKQLEAADLGVCKPQ